MEGMNIMQEKLKNLVAKATEETPAEDATPAPDATPAE